MIDDHQELEEPFEPQNVPKCGCGGVACPEQFYVRWAGDWKVLVDLHSGDQEHHIFVKAGFMLAGAGVGVGLAFLPKIVKQLRSQKKEGESSSGTGDTEETDPWADAPPLDDDESSL
mmetsp:Transcript_91815/g.160507  ORF Transcript_91815/g.160507 Transcript_91815/m.160507 type:complete len:117 (+) Transcript_91815:3-353(+)